MLRLLRLMAVLNLLLLPLLLLGGCDTPAAPPLRELPLAHDSVETWVGVSHLVGETGDNSLTGLEGRIDGVYEDFATGWIRNRRSDGAAVDVCMVARRFESPGGSDQSVADLDCARLDGGASTRLRVKLGACRTEVELIRGTEEVARRWASTNYLDVAYAGSVEGCGFDTCPTSAPYQWPDSCRTYPYEPPRDTPPSDPPPEDDDDGGGETPPGCDVVQHADPEEACYEPCPEGTKYDLELGQCIEPPPLPPPPQEHGACFYEVAGRGKEAYCLARGGIFSTHDGSDHCVFAFPGLADQRLNLAPGLSDPDCLRKQDAH